MHMTPIKRVALSLLAVSLAGTVAGPSLAQDEPEAFNAFAVAAANGTIVRAGEKQLMVVATLSGPFFIETGEGPVHAGRVTCAVSTRIDQASRKQAGNGACTFTAVDGATAWGDWTCEGYELLGCRGAFKLAGGTARLEGATGEGTMLWRPSTHELKKQLDGSVLDNATGILVWRDFKLKGK
jgi:hypothetical protein